MFLDAPDPGFVLSPEERSETFVAFDPDVVEQILRWVRPEHRDTIRRNFFVAPEHQLKIEGGLFFEAERPEVAALFKQLTQWDE
jgi:hypothetical protein